MRISFFRKKESSSFSTTCSIVRGYVDPNMAGHRSSTFAAKDHSSSNVERDYGTTI